MSASPSQIDQKSLSPAAKKRARDLTVGFSTALISHAKTMAYHEEADTVLTTHIDAAHDMLFARRERRAWWVEWGKFVGGGLFGAFIPGFVTELTKQGGPSTLLISLYTAFGIFGLLIVFLSLRK